MISIRHQFSFVIVAGVLWSTSSAAQIDAILFRSCSAVVSAYDAAVWAILREDIFSDEQIDRELFRIYYEIAPDIDLLHHRDDEAVTSQMINLLQLSVSPFHFLQFAPSEDPPPPEVTECFRNREFSACMEMFTRVADASRGLQQACGAAFSVE